MTTRAYLIRIRSMIFHRLVKVFIILLVGYLNSCEKFWDHEDQRTGSLSELTKTFIFNIGDTLTYKNSMGETGLFLISDTSKTFNICPCFYDMANEECSCNPYTGVALSIFIENVDGSDNCWEPEDTCRIKFTIHHYCNRHYGKWLTGTYVAVNNLFAKGQTIYHTYKDTNKDHPYDGRNLTPDLQNYTINNFNYNEVYIFNITNWALENIRVYFNFEYGILRYESPLGDYWELQL